LKIKVRKLNKIAKIPTYSHENSAGFDIYTSESVTIESLSTEIIRTGIAIELPVGYSLEIYQRPELSGNYPNYLANCIELIDSNFKGELVIVFRNSFFSKTINIPAFTCIAQGVVRKFEHAEFEEVEETKCLCQIA